MVHKIIQEKRWDLVVLYAVMLLICVAALFRAETASRKAKQVSGQAKTLAIENKHRVADINNLIADIQASRVASCQRTYEGVREVLRPLFPPKKGRTAKQQADLDTFNRTVDDLKKTCNTQVRTP